jgi:Skp family chaperone for outer membrane proteins
MKRTLYTAAAMILAASFVVGHAQTSDTTAPAKKHAPAKKAAAPAAPSVQDQIQALRTELQSQIDSLKSDLAAKDAELRKAQQDADDARAQANKAEADAQAQQQAATENSSAVSTLQSTVTDLKTNQASLATTVSDETTNLKKAIANPDVLHYKGITLSPTGSFLAAETVWRNSAMGDGLNTAFSKIPLQNSQAAQISEWQGSGRQSRLALKAVGKLNSMTMTGYYEMDWLSAGATSNNNQSNSYTLRQRQLWADAKLTNGWDFSGGQGWSLATETTKGLTRGTEILPASIDPQYVAGFVWTRQYSFRVSKDIGKSVFLGVSAENAETLNPAGSGLPTNYTFGTAGDGSGLYNSANNYSSNPAPDFVIKVAVEPGWGHWEVFNIDRFFRDRIYPTTGSAYNNTVEGEGIGGSVRGPLFNKKLTIGLKGLYGEGMGRYGSTTIADVTVRQDGSLAPLRAFSALSTVELNPTDRLNLYFNYGGDYVYREYWTTGTGTTAEGYGVPGKFTNSPIMTGCNTVATASGGTTTYAGTGTCAALTKDVQEFTAGYWFNIHNSAKGRLRQGIQYSWFERDLWSGLSGTANPGGGAHGNLNTIYTSFRYYLP